ncbi:MAG: SDR family oxidoreductase [Acidobacteria bacterium]|nr:MAG: SDR family oxidoreductase [Acidobacteriota bacterium]
MNATADAGPVLVVGGSGGIGAAVAEALRARGRRCWTGARNLPDDPATRRVRLDARDRGSIDAALARIAAHDGPPGAAVLAHGGGHFAPVARLVPDALREDLETHVVGTLHLLGALHEALAEGGAIVVVGSIAACEPLGDCGGYGAAKAAQRMLVRVAAEEFRDRRLRVTLIHPGAVDTAIWDGRPGFDRDRMLRPQAVARVIADLLEADREAHVTELTVLPPEGRL